MTARNWVLAGVLTGAGLFGAAGKAPAQGYFDYGTFGLNPYGGFANPYTGLGLGATFPGGYGYTPYTPNYYVGPAFGYSAYGLNTLPYYNYGTYAYSNPFAGRGFYSYSYTNPGFGPGFYNYRFGRYR